MSEDAWGHRPWVIVGAGRVGQLVGLMGAQGRATTPLVWSRSPEGAARARAVLGAEVSSGPLSEVAQQLLRLGPCVVWCTVADGAIAAVSEAIIESLAPGSVLLHTSGALSSEVLPRAPGVHRASVHPLLSVAHPEAALKAASGCAWTLEGDDDALGFARAFLRSHGVTPRVIDARGKVLYHASAVTSAGLLVALLDAAFEMCARAGIEQPAHTLLPLAQSCLDNLQTSRARQALTGPVARGDDATVRRHMEALGELDDPELAQIYAVLTRRSRAMMSRQEDT